MPANSYCTLIAILWLALSSAVSAGEKPQSISTLFDPNFLGANIEYLENKIGPPWKSNSGNRVYKIANCEMTVGIKDSKIRNLGLKISDTCFFDINKFVTNTKEKIHPLRHLTFGQFNKSVYDHGKFYSDCILNCGNSSDPVVHEFWEGSRADNSISIRLDVLVVGSKAVAASSAWSDLMAKVEGEDWVTFSQFNCEADRYSRAAENIYANVPITGITVGYDIDLPNCQRHDAVLFFDPHDFIVKNGYSAKGPAIDDKPTYVNGFTVSTPRVAEIEKAIRTSNKTDGARYFCSNMENKLKTKGVRLKTYGTNTSGIDACALSYQTGTQIIFSRQAREGLYVLFVTD